MRLYNQTKNALAWSMGGEAYEVEPWGPVDIADELVSPAKARGLPLDVTQVSPEERAQVRIADDRAASDQAPLLALKNQLELAQAAEREAKAECERLSVELSTARGELREAHESIERKASEIARLQADKDASERLMAEASAQATSSEERAIKAEALLAERTAPKAEKRGKQAEAGA